MKKLLTFCILILLVPGFFGFTAYAYDYEPIKYEIEVEVTLGGTVKIIPNVNCPIPQKTELTLKDGETGRFEIDLVEPGVFDYTVQTVPDDRNIVFDDTVYSIKIYVTENVDKLEANMIATKSEEKYSGTELRFVNDEKTSKPEESSNNDGNPKSGDDARMEMFFLFAMIASAGLITMITKKNKEKH